MRLKSLKIQNMNSLYGEWKINFETEEFKRGIFAITGETGSGKTTILDAIMLALFAKTPRLDAGSRLECVSKQANCCLVELEFAIGTDTYVARIGWNSYKATKKTPHPKLREDTLFHTLSKNGAYVTENLRDTSRVIPELIGMNATQFCQTVMLAQGKFNEFLQAEDREKAEILEKLTSTSRYADIGKAVFERKRAKEGELRELASKLEGMHFLSAEEEREKREALKARTDAMAEREKRQKALAALLQLLGRLENVRQLLTKNEEDQKHLEEQQRQFAPDAVRLAQGLKAARLQKPFQERETLRNTCEAERKEWTQQQMVIIPDAEQKEVAAKQVADEAQKALATGKVEGEKLEALLAQVTPLDQDIRSLDKSVSEMEQQMSKASADLAQRTTALKAAQKALASLETEKLQSETYLREHEQDGELPARQAAWGERLANLSSVRKQEAEQVKAVSDLRRKLTAATALEAASKASLEQVQKDLAQLERQEAVFLKAKEDALEGSKLEDLEKQQELLEQMISTIRVIVSFDEERKKLEDGKPCPLCGSLDHPLALGNVPEPSEKEAELRRVKCRIRGYQAAKDACGKAQEATAAGRLALSQAQNDHVRRQDDVSHQQEGIAQAEQILTALAQEQENLYQTLCQEFAVFGIHWDGKGTLPVAISQRLELWRQHEQKLNGFERIREGLTTKVSEVTGQVEKLTQDLKTREIEQKRRRERLEKLRQERQALFGNKQVEAERQSQQKVLEGLHGRANQALQSRVQAAETLRHQREVAHKLSALLQAHEGDLESKSRAFQAACEAEEMTEESYHQCVLPDDLLRELGSRKTALETRQKELVQHQTEWRESRRQLEEQLPEHCESEAIHEELDQLTAQLGEDGESCGELRQVLKQHEDNVKEAGVLRQMQERLESEKNLLEKMDSLIGGSDGAKFKKFAQHLTMMQLLEAANVRLQSMNPRYTLVPCGSDKLDIDVIDQEQGGEVRTGKNLSGGEQFMVSLSLALGLSAMASERKTVDFLFLDEGFGTLSDEPLNQAVEMLSQLRQQEGKTIGIISHVPIIGDLFPSIHVIKLGEGRSKLEGPGVSR